jgi:hypothetical protein
MKIEKRGPLSIKAVPFANGTAFILRGPFFYFRLRQINTPKANVAPIVFAKPSNQSNNLS